MLIVLRAGKPDKELGVKIFMRHSKYSFNFY